VRIGIDLGGTKIEGLAMAGNGRTLARERIPSPQGDYAETVRAVADLVSNLETETGSHGSVGIGIPGAISPATGLVKNANSTWLIGRPLDRDLAQALGRPVRVTNDANCFVLSEATDGAGSGHCVVFGVILGTGVGGGLTVGRRIIAGRHAIAGEWGHNPLPWPSASEFPGPECYCGKRGCIETFLSGPGLSQAHAKESGEWVSAERIAELAGAGDATARASLETYASWLARALATVINILDPDVIVLGGGLSRISALYGLVGGRLPQWVFSDRADTPILPPQHGDASGVRGAAWLWPNAADGREAPE
jgi:fructokinase